MINYFKGKVHFISFKHLESSQKFHISFSTYHPSYSHTLGQYPTLPLSTKIFLTYLVKSQMGIPFILDSFDLQRNYIFPSYSAPTKNYPNYMTVSTTHFSKNILVHSSKFSNFTQMKFGPDSNSLLKT